MANLVRIRASSLSDLLDCPHRWEGRQLLGMGGLNSGRAHLGTSVHHATGAFDQARIDAHDITADDAAGEFVNALWRPDYEVDYGEERPKDLERIGIKLVVGYCRGLALKQRYSHVEATMPALAITDLGIELTGTVDRIRIAGNAWGISDVKTGASAVNIEGDANVAEHIAQLGVYELLAEAELGTSPGLPAQIIGMNATAKQERIGTGHVIRPRDLLVGLGDSPGLLEHAAALIREGRFYGNPRSLLCGEKYCPRWATCRYRGR